MTEPCKRCGQPVKAVGRTFCSPNCALVWRNQNTMTLEKRVKISIALKNRLSPNRGRVHTEEARRNISLAHVGKPSLKKGIPTGKPAWNRDIPHTRETRHKISATRLRQEKKSEIMCGNGRPLPRAHQALYDALLPYGWVVEYPVSLGKRQPGWPTCYKLDLALIDRKIAIEVDGSKHRLFAQRRIDERRDSKLSELGWTIVRVTNETALSLAVIPVGEIVSRLFDGR